MPQGEERLGEVTAASPVSGSPPLGVCPQALFRSKRPGLQSCRLESHTFVKQPGGSYGDTA